MLKLKEIVSILGMSLVVSITNYAHAETLNVDRMSAAEILQEAKKLPSNDLKAFRLYSVAAKKGSQEAIEHLAMFYLYVDKDMSSCIRELEKLKNKNKKSLTHLSNIIKFVSILNQINPENKRIRCRESTINMM